MTSTPLIKRHHAHVVLTAALGAVGGFVACAGGLSLLGYALGGLSAALSCGFWMALRSARNRQLGELAQLSADTGMTRGVWTPNSALPDEVLQAFNRLLYQLHDAQAQLESLNPLVASYEQMAEHTEDLGVRINAAGYLTYVTPSANRHPGCAARRDGWSARLRPASPR